MSIEQHAEAAVKEYLAHLDMAADECQVCMLIFTRHMKSAIDEATAPLRARIAELEGLGPLIKEFGDACEAIGHSNRRNEDAQVDWMHRTEAKITAILKGGA